MKLSYPSLHNGCCGALGGMYRGATKASGMLLDAAAGERAPVVTPCVLCRDNLRSAARELKHDVPVHFWPDFFRAAPTAPEVTTDAYDKAKKDPMAARVTVKEDAIATAKAGRAIAPETDAPTSTTRTPTSPSVVHGPLRDPPGPDRQDHQRPAHARSQGRL